MENLNYNLFDFWQIVCSITVSLRIHHDGGTVEKAPRATHPAVNLQVVSRMPPKDLSTVGNSVTSKRIVSERRI